MKSKINFIGIGAQKAGTSWLFKQFEQSKQFALPPIKELHYFDRSTEYLSPNFLTETYLIERIKSPKWVLRALFNSIRDIKNINWYFRWYFSNYNDDWYLSLFKNLNGCKGEITPAYAILKEEDVARMSNLLGRDTKIIFMMRNPIERAWSSYKYRFLTQKNPKPKFKEAKDFLQSDYQILRSQYSKTIYLYNKYFDSIFIGFFDAILDDPKQLLADLFNYLELDSTEINKFNDLDKKINNSNSIQMPSDIKMMLDDIYLHEIDKLSFEYGEYFIKWQNPRRYASNNFKSSFVIKS